MQPSNWASALKKNLKLESTSGQTNQDAAHPDLASHQDGIVPAAATSVAHPAAPGGGEPNSKAAARQRLLTEALKSRANAVTGERHCLGCGRGFHDLSRFVQHILDKHNGINSSEPVPTAVHNYQNVTTAVGGGVGFPSLAPTEMKPPLKLADVAIVKTKHGAVSNSLQPGRNNKKKEKEIDKAAPAAATTNIGPHHQRLGSRKPDPTAFQAPEGTHAKRKKRPSRLKRIYRRTKAEAAVEHWLSVLSAVEEALQLVGELHGALSNEMQALQQQIQTQQQVEQDVYINKATMNFAQALRAGSTAPPSEKKNNSTAETGSGSGLAVPLMQLQALQMQVRTTSEKLEQLGSIHATARVSLVKSQEQLVSAQGGGSGGGGGGKKKLTVAAGFLSNSIPQELNPSFIPQVAKKEQVLEEKHALEAEKIPATTTNIEPQPTPPSASASDEIAEEFNESASSSIEKEESSSSTSSTSTNTSTASSSSSSSSSGSSSGDSDSDGDFGLQWGDTLRAWATTVGVDARKSLQEQHHQVVKSKKKHQILRGEEQASAEIKKVQQSSTSAEPKNPGGKEKENTAELEKLELSLPSKPDNLNNNIVPDSVPPPPLAAAAITTTTTAPLVVDDAPTAPPATELEQPDAIGSWLEAAIFDTTTQIEALSTASHSTGGSPSLNEKSFGEAAAPPDDVFGRKLDDNDDVGASLVPSAATNTPTPANVDAPFHCVVCNITASGLKPWQDHLASRRHATKIAKIVQTTNPLPASHNPPQKQKKNQTNVILLNEVSVSVRPSLPGKCYTGPNATDIEPYVTHIITPELNEATTALLKQLLEWQERTRRLDPVNFKRKRRLVSGMREVQKLVKMNKAKLLIVAPNIGPVPTTSTSEIETVAPPTTTTAMAYPIQSALDMAKERGIPTVFALTRQRMGKILGARKTASAFVVLDASGAEQLLAKVLELAAVAGGSRTKQL